MTIKENLLLSNYEIIKTVKSKIDIGVTYNVRIGIRCPSCKNQIPTIGHNKETICKNCGLRIYESGNCLTCTKSD